jgi:hypothetical protein
MDCPYYEQLQYIGDSRVQAMISLYQTVDHDFNANGIRRFGIPLLDPEKHFLGILAVAQRQTPRAQAETAQIIKAIQANT